MPPETGAGIPQADRNFRASGEIPPRGENKELTSRQALAERKKAILAMGDITPDDRAILAEPLFKSGEKVWVERSDGKVDEGWSVVQTDDEGRVFVAKELPDPNTGRLTTATKKITEAKLAQLNP